MPVTQQPPEVGGWPSLQMSQYVSSHFGWQVESVHSCVIWNPRSPSSASSALSEQPNGSSSQVISSRAPGKRIARRDVYMLLAFFEEPVRRSATKHSTG